MLERFLEMIVHNAMHQAYHLAFENVLKPVGKALFSDPEDDRRAEFERHLQRMGRTQKEIRQEEIEKILRTTKQTR